jgi:hypothetical protein
MLTSRHIDPLERRTRIRRNVATFAAILGGVLLSGRQEDVEFFENTQHVKYSQKPNFFVRESNNCNNERISIILTFARCAQLVYMHFAECVSRAYQHYLDGLLIRVTDFVNFGANHPVD